MKDFRKLKVWEKAHQLTLSIYRATRGFPAEERYGETAQIRRASSSVPGNIAEGCGRGTDADFAHFLQMAMGSASELECRLLLARDLEWLDAESHQTLEAQATEVKRMLASLIRKLRPDT